MKLNEISDKSSARRPRKRVGRGIGSGTGKTAARGHKGQKSRSGVSLIGFEGGQMPLYRRLPKGGFKNIFRKKYRIINLSRLQKAIEAKKLDVSEKITEATLLEAGIIKSVRDGVRILGKGEIKEKINIEISGASAKAVSAITGAGGTIEITPVKPNLARVSDKNNKIAKEPDGASADKE
tara:strand:- start:14 stop:553 length:540 start_codon:yes stop_codon:yes gene_type:complete